MTTYNDIMKPVRTPSTYPQPKRNEFVVNTPNHNWKVSCKRGVWSAVSGNKKLTADTQQAILNACRMADNWTMEQSVTNLQTQLAKLTENKDMGISGRISDVTARYIVTIEPDEPDADTVSCQVIATRSNGEIIQLGYLSNYELDKTLISVIRTLPVNGNSQTLYLYEV